MNQLLNRFCALAFAVFFIACGDDDPSGPEASLLGTWQWTKVVRTDCTDPSFLGTVAADCPDLCGTVTFTGEIQTLTYWNPNQSEPQVSTGTYAVSGDVINSCTQDNGQQTCTTATFSLSGNNLILTSLEEDNGCTVTTTYTKV